MKAFHLLLGFLWILLQSREYVEGQNFNESVYLSTNASAIISNNNNDSDVLLYNTTLKLETKIVSNLKVIESNISESVHMKQNCLNGRCLSVHSSSEPSSTLYTSRNISILEMLRNNLFLLLQHKFINYIQYIRSLISNALNRLRWKVFPFHQEQSVLLNSSLENMSNSNSSSDVDSVFQSLDTLSSDHFPRDGFDASSASSSSTFDDRTDVLFRHAPQIGVLQHNSFLHRLIRGRKKVSNVHCASDTGISSSGDAKSTDETSSTRQLHSQIQDEPSPEFRPSGDSKFTSTSVLIQKLADIFAWLSRDVLYEFHILSSHADVEVGVNEASLGPHFLLCLAVMVGLVLSILRCHQWLKYSADFSDYDQDCDEVEHSKEERSRAGSKSERKRHMDSNSGTFTPLVTSPLRRVIADIISVGLLILSVLGVWAYLLAVERTVRAKQAERVRVLAVNEFMNRGTSSSSSVGPGKVNMARTRYANNSMISVLDSSLSGNESSTKYIDLATVKLETLNLEWLNSAIDALWSVDGDGGFGPYVSQSIAKVLNDELALVPPGIAHIRLKSFSLGDHPPVIWSASSKYQVRNSSQCAHLHKEMVEMLNRRHSWQHTKMSKKNAKSEMPFNIMDIIVPLSRFVDVAVFASTKLFQRLSTGHFFSNDTSTNDDRDTNRRRRRSKLPGGFDPNNYKYKDRKYSNDGHTRGCQLLILDTDFGYSSKDLEIVLGIRSNELQGMFTEITVALTELIFSGKFRLNIELIPEYPFFGNCTFLFLETPRFDMTISGFGTVDLSAIPGVYSWINGTAHWLLQQYTYPNHGTYDLKKFICPKCDEPLPPTLPQRLISALESLRRTTASRLHDVLTGWNRMRKVMKMKWTEFHQGLRSMGRPQKSALELLLDSSIPQ